MGASIGPRVFILGFTTNGIFIVGGHEVMVWVFVVIWVLFSLPERPRSGLVSDCAEMITTHDCCDLKSCWKWEVNWFRFMRHGWASTCTAAPCHTSRISLQLPSVLTALTTTSSIPSYFLRRVGLAALGQPRCYQASTHGTRWKCI